MDKETGGVRLLKKWQTGLWNLLFSRMTLFLVLLLLQFLMLFSFFFWLEDFLPHVVGGQFLLTCGMLVYLLNSRLDPTGKITWLVVIMIAPVFGSLLYLFSVKEIGHRAMKKRLAFLTEQAKPLLPQQEAALQQLKAQRPGAAALANYLHNRGGYPIYTDTQAQYLPTGKAFLEKLLFELEQAKKSVFLQFFIIEEGTMWGQVLDVLIRKAAQGVDVRVIYDGTCEFTLLPKGYPKMLARYGIRCKVFSPFVPFVSTHYNYRNHRKIAVIDGRTAFTGGINLADEYIEAREKFGRWKDTGIMLKGPAVRSFTQMFLKSWNLDVKQPEYAPMEVQPMPVTAQGLVLPYGDQPLDGERIGQNVYLSMLSRARSYVYIMTPYLILDGEMENALIYAAARGVQVKLILPGVPDKKIPYALAKTHYPALLESGVEIYEYTPGFVHAKVILCDGVEAVVGTINLDYRSLFHHFECAAYLYDTPCLGEVQADFADTLTQCRRVTPETVRKERWSLRLLGKLCKLFAPLL